MQKQLELIILIAENLKELIINTFNTNNQKDLPESVIERLDLITDYNRTVAILEYLRDFDKEKVMEMYNWTEHEAKYNKKIIFDKLEERKKELSKLLGDNFFDGE